METTKVVCNKEFQIDRVDSRLFGSFLEHMGRVIYSGIYEPDNKNADEDGFRQDVIDRVKEMNVTTVRYPGGNFVSAYHWEDGVGAKEKRPHKLDLAWRSIETNEFGTNEFMKWAKKTNVNPIFTVNLGTRGVEDAAHYLEYCNFSSGTQYSDMRKSHGVDEPYGIKMWCLGNAQTIIGQISVTCGKIIGYAKQHQPGHIMLADVVAEVHISFAALGFHRGNGGIQLVLVVPHVLHGHRVVGAQQPNAAILCAVHAG